jgi:hypothetical protein
MAEQETLLLFDQGVTHMRKFAILMTVLASAGAFAPLAANAATGTSMYQPSPIIVHTPTHHNKKMARGRAAYDQQINAIRSNHVTG